MFTIKNSNLIGDDRTIDHFLCKHCVEQYVKDLKGVKKKIKKNGKKILANVFIMKFKCIFCLEEHTTKITLDCKDQNSCQCCNIY